MKKIGIFSLVLIWVLSVSIMPAMAIYSSDTSSSVVSSIALTAIGDASIKWSANGYSSSGYKVVWSKNQNPSYPTRSGDKYHYYSSPDKNTDTLTAFSGDGIYYVRVCEYLGGKCGTYSNQITLSLGSEKVVLADNYSSKKVNSITLKSEGSYVVWSVDGYSEKGFKVVWSKYPNPTYPIRENDKYAYYSDPNKRKSMLTPFSGDGNYYVRVCEYLGGSCGTYSNQITVNLAAKACTMEYNPVCGADGKTYSNKCMAETAGTYKQYYGECKVDDEIKAIEAKAETLSDNNLDAILAELQELRSLVKEQQTQINHLQRLVQNVSAITTEMQNSINSFITYGVDDNTKRLGEGERAAVMYSFKEAYGKLPENEDELADAIKIANGRFPSMSSEAAEERAKALFEKIYKRSADMSNARDEAAITIMAYGLRQKAENRNLNSEKNGIAIFKGVFGYTPSTTKDWNTMQAITYSGASR